MLNDKDIEDMVEKLKAPVKDAAAPSEEKNAPAREVKTVTNPAKEVPVGTTFDQVIVALKSGKSAQRAGWKGLTLVPGKDDRGNTELNFETASGTARAALHNNDLLAGDWQIID